MSPEGGSPSQYWRQILGGCTRIVSGEIKTVTFPNPGEEPILSFQGHNYWHKPLKNEEGEVIGHEIQWSLLPQSYEYLLKQRSIVGRKS